MIKIKSDSERIYNKLVDDATNIAWSEYMREVVTPLYLLYKKSTRTEGGQLLPVRQGQPAPEGFLLVSEGPIPRNATKEMIRAWIYNRCRGLSILPHRD